MKPIHHATLLGNLKILEFLCNSGADVNTTISNRYLSTPLHIAARHDKLEIAKFYLIVMLTSMLQIIKALHLCT